MHKNQNLISQRKLSSTNKRLLRKLKYKILSNINLSPIIYRIKLILQLKVFIQLLNPLMQLQKSTFFIISKEFLRMVYPIINTHHKRYIFPIFSIILQQQLLSNYFLNHLSLPLNLNRSSIHQSPRILFLYKFSIIYLPILSFIFKLVAFQIRS